MIAGLLLALPVLALPQGGRPLPEPELAVRAARIHVSPGQVLEDAWLLVGQGRVAGYATSEAELPPFVPVLDLGEAVLMPGLVAADSTLTGAGPQGERSLAAHRRALDEFDPFADLHTVLERGVTTCYLSPDRNRLVGGRGAVVKTAGRQRVLRAEADLRISLEGGRNAAGRWFRPPMPPSSENPLEPARPQPPGSRAGALLALRQDFERARSGGIPWSDLHLRALAEFLEGRPSLRVAVETTGEVQAALDFAAEQGLPVILDGATRARDLPGLLEGREASLIFDVPLFLGDPGDLPPDWEEPGPEALAGLGGDRLALGVGRHGRWTMLLEAAQAALDYGLSREDALRAITWSPALLLGVADRVGALAPGFDADFLVLSGDPLEPGTRVQEVFVEGRRVFQSEDFALEEFEDAVVIRAGTLWPGDGPPRTGGVEVLMAGGRILDFGRAVARPPGVRVLDAGPEAHLTPGFVDARSLFPLASARPEAGAALGLLAAGTRWNPAWQALARSGVTTQVMASSSLGQGTLAPIVKTSAVLPEQAFLEDEGVVFFDFTGSNRTGRREQIQGLLDQGRRYAEQWKKYREERKKWEEEQAKKRAEERAKAEAELRKRLAGGETVRKEESTAEESDPKQDEEAPEEEAAAKKDPINGLWELVLEHEMLPEPMTVHVRLSHEKERVLAVISLPDMPEAGTQELEGTWDEASQTMTFTQHTEVGPVTVEGVVESEDLMRVTISVGALGSAEFEAHRIEYDDSAAAALQLPRKRRGKKEGPQPPKTDARLEGVRALLEGRAVALARARRGDEIQNAVEVLGGAGIPFAILEGDQALDRAGLLREKGAGVVVPRELVQRRDQREWVPAALLAAEGLPVAFQSASPRGGRFLARNLVLAVRSGLGRETALEALTAGAARMLGIEDRVGRIARGLDGDLVVHDGPPLEPGTRILTVFVSGQEVPKP